MGYHVQMGIGKLVNTETRTWKKVDSNVMIEFAVGMFLKYTLVDHLPLGAKGRYPRPGCCVWKFKNLGKGKGF